MAVILMACFSTSANAQARVYTKGHVWNISMIKTMPGMTDDYIASLKTTIKAMEDEGIKEGLELSYKILTGESSNEDDYNIIIMSEFTDMNSASGNQDKWDAIQAKVVGDNAALKQIMGTRTNMRTIMGTKTMEEVVYK